MEGDPWGGKPVSEVYRLTFERIRRRVEASGQRFEQDKAVRILAEMHTEHIKDLIDEDMTGYDKRKLTDIVERCVARYVQLEE